MSGLKSIIDSIPLRVSRPATWTDGSMYPSKKGKVTTEEAKKISQDLGIKMDEKQLEQFRRGMEVELEHGRFAKCNTCKVSINVTNDELHLTGMIAMAHLSEMSDYYVKLAVMEGEEEE